LFLAFAEEFRKNNICHSQLKKKMRSLDVSPEDMAKRIARFKDLKPYKESIMENTGVPAEATGFVSPKAVYLIMSPEGWTGRSAIAPVKGRDGLTMVIAECLPGDKPGLHNHAKTIENFFCLNGRFRISWGEDGENSTELEPLDFISVPAGVYRDFENISDETARSLVTIQIPERDPRDEVIFHPQVGDAIADKFDEDTVKKMGSGGFRFADRLPAEER
jgi:uncharacterized RmlC-like cupin family protein